MTTALIIGFWALLIGAAFWCFLNMDAEGRPFTEWAGPGRGLPRTRVIGTPLEREALELADYVSGCDPRFVAIGTKAREKTGLCCEGGVARLLHRRMIADTLAEFAPRADQQAQEIAGIEQPPVCCDDREAFLVIAGKP